MTEVVRVNKSGQRMSCSLCYRTTPKIYLSSCFHSYCPDCLQNRVTTPGQYKCPLCQTAVNVSETDNRDYNLRESLSPSGNVQTVRIGETGDSQPFTTRQLITDSSGNLINVLPVSSVSDDNVVNVISTSPNTRSYVLNTSRSSPRNREFSRTYVAGSPNSGEGQDLRSGETPTRVNFISTSSMGNKTKYGNGIEVTRTRISASPVPQSLPNAGTWTASQSSDSSLGRTCDICQDGRKAASLCLKCDQYFCQTCSTAHAKMKASRYHEQQPVVRADSIPPQNSISSREKTAEYCSRHGNPISQICKRCEMMICTVCKSLEHVGHVTRSVTDEAGEVRKNLTHVLQRQITLSESLRLQIIEAERRKDMYPRDLDQELGKLNHQIEEMQLELEREREKATDELENHYKDHAQRNDEMLHSTQRNYNDLMSIKSEALEMLNSNDDVYVATRGSRLQKRLEDIERDSRRTENPASGPTLQFYQGEIDPGKLRNMFGGVTSGNERYEAFPRNSSQATIQSITSRSTPRTSRSDNNNLVQISQFSLPFNDGVGYIYGIAPVDSNKAWVSMMGHTNVVLVTQKGNIINSVNLGDIVEDVAHDGAGGCYVTCPSSKSVKHVTKDGLVTTLVDELRDDPHGIAVYQYFDRDKNAMTQEIFVCFTEARGTRTTFYDKPKGAVHILSASGEDLGRGFHMPSPMRIDTYTDSSLICISDHSNGCVTVSDITGQNVRALYTGNEQENFKPLGVCFDDNGLVIIADWKSEEVIRINEDGTRMQFLVQDVKGPQSVAAKGGYLWVGGKQGVVHVFQMDN